MYGHTAVTNDYHPKHQFGRTWNKSLTALTEKEEQL
jgi:hypothetical protein